MRSAREPIGALARRTSEGVAGFLRSEIFAGTLKAGEALRERTLAERLNVSRTPVREALFILQSEGLVELRPNRGASVRSLNPYDLAEVYQIRGLLESHAAELAAIAAGQDEIDAMEDAQIRLGRMLRRGSAADQAAADQAFHTAVLDATHNALLASLVNQILSFTLSLRASYASAVPRSEQALAEHDLIIDAIRKRNGTEASILMGKHIESSCAYALDQFRATHGGPDNKGAQGDPAGSA